jgi:hypothetical protein
MHKYMPLTLCFGCRSSQHRDSPTPAAPEPGGLAA